MFLVTVLYFCREPCHAVPLVVSPSRVTSYQCGQGVPFCLMRHCMCPDSNRSALCTCSLGPVTPGTSISPRTASSAGSKPLDNLDLVEDSDVHSRLACITQENHTIKAQLSQLTELVWQLLPQPAQAAPQLAEASNMPPASSPVEGQAAGTSVQVLAFPLHPSLIPETQPLGYHLVAFGQCC